MSTNHPTHDVTNYEGMPDDPVTDFIGDAPVSSRTDDWIWLRNTAIQAVVDSFERHNISRGDTARKLQSLGVQGPALMRVLNKAQRRRDAQPYGYEDGRCVECQATNGGHFNNCAAIN